MSVESFDSYRFQQQVDKALVSVKKILDTTRAPALPSEISHAYQDKYWLAEVLTNVAVAAVGVTFDEATNTAISPHTASTSAGPVAGSAAAAAAAASISSSSAGSTSGSALGLSDSTWVLLQRLCSAGQAVTLRFVASEKCTFEKEQTRKVESPEYVTETTSSVFGTSKRSEKVVTTIKEWLWQFNFQWKLLAYSGVHAEEKNSLLLADGKGGGQIVTTTKDTPKPENVARSPIDVNITWLLKQVKDSAQQTAFLQTAFKIDRKKDSCRTPRRNEDIDAAYEFFTNLFSWTHQVSTYFNLYVYPVVPSNLLPFKWESMTELTTRLFNPVVPLFEEKPKNEGKPEEKASTNATTVGPLRLTDGFGVGLSSDSPLLPVSDANAFLSELRRSSREAISSISGIFSGVDSNAKLLSLPLIRLLAHLQHLRNICVAWGDGVNYIEDMLRKQFLAAIGKEVSASDFNEYMKYHSKKIFKQQYQTKPFAFAIRRDEQFPEGTLTIEAKPEGDYHTMGSSNVSAQPVEGFQRQLPSFPMRFKLNASTNVTFHGERYAHGLLFHQFAGARGQNLQLLARSRQFSSFILCLGSLSGADEFSIKSALIVQNRDELTIPILCESFPSAKEFKDAIESLSPEQQRFCKQYRKMQLATSLFAVLIIQIKPQVEKVLNLDPCALIKEIKLSEDVLELFIKYQIPPDMLAYDPLVDGRGDATQKIKAVRRHVDDIQKIIAGLKSSQLKEQEAKADFAIAQAYSSSSTSLSKSVPMRAMATNRSAAPVMAYAAPSFAGMSIGGAMGGAAPPPPPSAPSGMMMDLMSAAPAPSTPPVPVPAPAPSGGPTQQPAQISQQQQQGGEEKHADTSVVTGKPTGNAPMDLSRLPQELDSSLERFDLDGSVRPTTLKLSSTWSKLSYASLLSGSSTAFLQPTQQDSERNRAFDLLDCLSRSGGLSIDYAAVHVVVAVTHCFDKALIDTVVIDNVNPIEKVERTHLILAQQLQQCNARQLLKDEAVDDIKKFAAPNIFRLQEAESADEHKNRDGKD